MHTQQQRRTRRGICALTLAGLALLSQPVAFAQGEGADPGHSAAVADIAKSVLFDPTTYAPAVISYGATYVDWKTSQPFFQHGLVEHNFRFTVSGLSNDIPISYGDGKRKILMDTVVNLQTSLVNNVSSRVIERLLLERYRDHTKVVRTIGWVERIAFSSCMSYALSAAHFRQFQENERDARAKGFE